MRGAIAHLKNAKVTGYQTYDEIAGLLPKGEIDAFALSRDQLNAMSKKIPGTRVLDETFKQTVDRNRSTAQSSAVAGLRGEIPDRGDQQRHAAQGLRQ